MSRWLPAVSISLLSCLVLSQTPAVARIAHADVTVSPFADGASFGEAGPYERVTGTVTGELDPSDSRNAGIADIKLAPRNSKGLVEYKTDFFMLRPKDPAKGSHMLVYDVLNRGRKFLFNWVLDAPEQAVQAVNDPKTLTDTGNALLLRRGDTIVWSGWEAGAPRLANGMAIDLPVATQNGKADGPAIVERVRDEFVNGTRGPLDAPFVLSFTPATMDKSKAHLTMRRREADPAEDISGSGWTYSGPNQIALLPAGTKASPGALYEFTYEARDPKVQGIGFAATRDVVAALRRDGPSGKSLSGGAITHAIAIGISQSGRFLRDLIHQGFNQDEDGKKVFDGVLGHISGAGGVFLNARFAQPSRTNTQHQDHLYPENAFPFSAATLHDPVTGVTGSLLRHDGFDPLLIETNTSTEYWQKGASLLTTTPLGTEDVALPGNVRAYLISSAFHYGRPGLSDARGPCANPRNTLSPAPVLRALLVDLEDWTVSGIAAPDSRVPRLSGGTLVAPGETGFPAIPGFAVSLHTNTIVRFKNDVEPQAEPGPQYEARVPVVDEMGNDVAGIRLPEVQVPLATRTGWNLYAEPFPPGELCDREGSMMALAKSDADKTKGDARPSAAALYPSPEAYAAKVKAAAEMLVAARLLLPEDAEKAIIAARQMGARP